MFNHQLKNKFSHFFTAEVGGVSPEQIVRAGLTFSAAAGALGMLANNAEADGPCEPCSSWTKNCVHPRAGHWKCAEKCEASINGEWVEVCEETTCIVVGDTRGLCD